MHDKQSETEVGGEDSFMPLINRLLPQIASLQNAKLLPLMEPIVFHYMMVSLTAMLAEFGPEMAVTASSKLAADDPRMAKSYWQSSR